MSEIKNRPTGHNKGERIMKFTHWTIGIIGAIASASSAAPDFNDIDAQTAPWRDHLYAGEPATIAFIGDSISYRNDTWIWFVRDLLRDRFGDAGVGYLAFHPGFNAAPAGQNGPQPGLAFQWSNPGGTAIQFAQTNGPRDPNRGALSPDGLWTVISGAGKVWMTAPGTDATIYFVTSPDGGTLRITIDGAQVAALDAHSDSPAIASHAFSLGDGATTTFAVESVTGEPIQVNGVDIRNGAGGHLGIRISRGGCGPADFLVAADAEVASELAALSPDLAIVMLDWEYNAPGEPAAFADDLGALMAFYEAAMPSTKFILASHHPYSPAMEQEAEIVYQTALARGHGFLNLYTTWPNAAAMQGAGLLVDNIHLSAVGGDWFARYYLDALLGPECTGDLTNDRRVDVDDLNVVLSNWASAGAGWSGGDADQDGDVDVDDLNAVLSAWACQG